MAQEKAKALKFPIKARFERKSDGARVVGEIRPTQLQDVAAQLLWDYKRHDRDAPDREWDWIGIYVQSQRNPREYECYSAIVGDVLHALICLDLNGQETSHGLGLVVDYLATNPADRPGGTGLRFTAVALMAIAVSRSIELGMAGRLWLESLPLANTLRFYKNLGLTEREEKSADGYPIFVLRVDAANEFLYRFRQRGITEL